MKAVTNKVLTYKSTGKPVRVGDRTVTFRGETVTVIAINPPSHEGSTGRVTVKFDNGLVREYFPPVIDSEWREPVKNPEIDFASIGAAFTQIEDDAKNAQRSVAHKDKEEVEDFIDSIMNYVRSIRHQLNSQQ